MSEKFNQIAEYSLALLQLLYKEGELSTRIALQRFEESYRDRIPDDMYSMVGNEVKWSNRVRWDRLSLARLNLMGNDRRGVWYITVKGRSFLENHHEDVLSELQRLLSSDAVRAKEERQKRAKNISSTSKISPDADQRKNAGSPKKSKRNQPNTYESRAPNLRELNAHRKLDQEIQTIRDYLNGASNLQPSNELLCDWVNFCYLFEFYTEGASLYPLISVEDVDLWYFERTRKLARLCSLKAR